jgi:UDP-glucose 4-epimerase
MATTKRKIAVTGGSGELGTLVLRRLCADRTVGEVVSLDLQPPRLASSKLTAVHADVRDPDFARHLHGCDAVVHLAFIVVGWRPRAEFDAVNVEGSKNVFRAAIAAGVKQIVYSSSVAAYGCVPGHPVPIVESTPRRHQPEFPYSAAKYQVEAFLDELEPQHPEVAIARLRPAILVGVHMEHGLGNVMRRGILPDSGEVPMPLVWDEDVADAVVLALQKGARGAFNLSAGELVPTRELARIGGLKVVHVPKMIARGVQQGAQLLAPLLLRLHVAGATDPAWISVGDVPLVMSTDKAKEVLGWKPSAPTAAAVVRRYVETVPRKLDRRIDLFLRLLTLAPRDQEMPAEARRMRVSMHLQLTGPDGGDIALTFDAGRITIEHEVPRPPQATITMKASTLRALLTGKLDYTTATLTGKIRVEGEGLAALVLQGIVETFRGITKKPGATGFATRQLERWFARGENAV